MVVRTSLPVGQQQARTRWGTHASGEAFDRKKFSYLTDQAQEFLAQQAFCVAAGLDTQNEMSGLLVLETPGFVQTPNEQTCLVHLNNSLANSRLLESLQRTSLNGQATKLGLFFISHPTRERLCVHGTAQLFPDSISGSSTQVPASIWGRLREIVYGRKRIVQKIEAQQSLWVRLHVEQSFFHCAKYIRTRVPGLTSLVVEPPKRTSSLQKPLHVSDSTLTEEIRAFIAQRFLCFLCTVNQAGQCAINHRNGHPGFLITVPPGVTAPGGMILLPDYSGNGAFEAVGNIFETGKAALMIPDYVTQQALFVSGSASILELGELPPYLARKCVGAERVVAISVQHVDVQAGDWSVTLAYERARAESILTTGEHTNTCTI